MAITSFYLLNIFPRMRTLSSSPNTQAQHSSQTCSLRCALYIITQQSTPNTQAKHVPSDAHLTSSSNSQHPTANNQTCSLGCALLHHQPTINTHHPSQTCSLRCALYIITEQSTPNTQTKHVPSNAHFTSSPNSQHPTPRQTCSLRCALYIITEQSTPNTHDRDSIDFSIKLAC